MCPYFWNYAFTLLFLPIILPLKLLFLGIVRILPYLGAISKLFGAIGQSSIYKQVASRVTKITKPSRFWDITGRGCNYLFLAMVGGMALLAVAGLIYAGWGHPIESLAFIGGITIGVLFIMLMVYLFTQQNLGTILGKPFRLVGDMAYNLYKNICPIVNWN